MDSADETTIELREADGEDEPAASPTDAIRAYMRHSPLSGLLLLCALAAFGWAIYLLCAETLTGHTDPPRPASKIVDGDDAKAVCVRELVQKGSLAERDLDLL